jgi:hypothetical protein
MPQRLKIAFVVRRIGMRSREERCYKACNCRVRVSKAVRTTTKDDETQGLHGDNVHAIPEVLMVHIVLENTIGTPDASYAERFACSSHDHSDRQGNLI